MCATYNVPHRKLTWLITGGSSGTGLSLVRFAQANGHTVITTSRNPAKTPSLISEIECNGGKLLALDLTNQAGESFIPALEDSGIHIDVLVNNAGSCTFGIVETTTEEELRLQMETMYHGPLRLIRSVLPFMRRRRFGVIVNMSSGAALDGRPCMGAYAGAKAGLDGLTKVLVKEVIQFNIRALTVFLGSLNTNFCASATFGRVPLPEDYKGSTGDVLMGAISNGVMPIYGDKDKAMKAIYEIIIGSGEGASHQSETMIFLGPDMTERVNFLQAALQHSLAKFSELANSVNTRK